MQPGRLPDSPLLRRMQAVLGAPVVVGARYQATQAPFRVERGRVFFEDLKLRAEPMHLEAGGWVGFDGPLAVRVLARVPRGLLRVEGISSAVLDTLTNEAGLVVIPLQVSGTQQDPAVRPDAGALTSQARQGAGRLLARKAMDGLKGLLRRPK